MSKGCLKLVYDQLVLFGDSIMEHSSTLQQGFAMATALQEKYIRRLDILNRGFSGYNSIQALRVLPQILPHPSVAAVRLLVIILGANDAGFGVPAHGPNPHVPLSEYRQNLIEMIDLPAVRAHAPRIILVAPPPIEERLMAKRVEELGLTGMTWTNSVTRTYADAVSDVAKEQNVQFLDLFAILMTEAGWKPGQPFPGSLDQPENEIMKRLIFDGTHLSGDAYVLYERELMRVINETWPDLSPDHLPYVVPEWDDEKAWPPGWDLGVTGTTEDQHSKEGSCEV